MWRYLLILKDEPKTTKEGKLGMFTFFVTTSGFTATRPSRFPPSDNTRSCVPWVKLVCEWCEGGAEEASWCRWCKGVLAAEVSFGPGGLWLVFEYPVINKGVWYCRPETKPNENSIMQGNAWSKFFFMFLPDIKTNAAYHWAPRLKIFCLSLLSDHEEIPQPLHCWP